MPELYYTAVIKDGKVFTDADGFAYAEHFEDAAERDKRARQFASVCHAGPEFMLYQGTEPAESWIARQGFRVYDPDGNETPDAYHKAIDAHAAKAGDKTVSKLTAPEVDDSQEARPLPEWAIAQHTVDAAHQVLIDARAAVTVANKRAQDLADFANGPRSPESEPMSKDQLAFAREAANGAQIEADRAMGRMYHAEQDYSEKKAKYDSLAPAAKPKEGKKNA